MVCIRTNDPKAKLMCRWVQSWKYNKMVDSNIILYSKLNLSDKYKNAKFLTSTEKKNTIWQLLHIFHNDIVVKGREAVVSFSLKPNL